MAISYTWVVKHLNTDTRGYVNTGVFEMQGVDEFENTANGSVTVCFGADEIKPLSQWTQAAIDSYAETKRSYIEQMINEDIQAKVAALEAK